MEKNIQDKITALEAAINSPATPENIKETMRKALDTLRNQKVEVTPYKTYSTIKSCLLDDGDDSDDYIYEGKLIHNVEVLPKDTWEIVEFYNYGVVLKHIPTSVLADSKPNKNVSLDELKSLFASDKIEIDGIEKGNTKLFNICIKAIIKCIDSLDMAAYKENLLAELNASKTELEKTIEASNLLESEKNAILSEKSNLEKESSEKIISMEEATRLKDDETTRLKKQLEDLEALNSMRTLIDMLQDDVASKILSSGTKEDLHKFLEVPDGKEPKVEQIFPKQKVKVKEIRLFAAEGKVSGYGFPKVVNTYEEANDAVMPVYEDAIEFEGNTNKCRFTVTFEDEETYNGDLLVGEKYDNPTKGNVIGNHIKDYLERDLKDDRVSDGTKKEIREFLENYDLGFDSYESGGNVKGTWGQSFPEVGRTGMFKGAEVIVTANRTGDVLFDELDENEKVVKSDKASLSEFRSYFRPFEPRETDVIYENGGKIDAGDKVIITTDSLGEKYKGMQGTINDRKLTGDDMYSVKLEDGMEMVFHKDEFRHNSVNPRW